MKPLDVFLHETLALLSSANRTSFKRGQKAIIKGIKAFLLQQSWLVGCFGFNGPLRQYFSLYRAVSQREGERGEKG